MDSTDIEEKSFLLSKFDYVFGTTKGIISLIILIEFLIILFLSTFSEPVVNVLGFPILPISLDDAHRAGRIIAMYHALAVPFIAAVAFYLIDICDVRPTFLSPIRWTLIPGAFLTGVSGIVFAYILPLNWAVHGLYLVGLSLSFFAGLLLLISLIPSKNFPDPEKHKEGPYLWGINLEQFNLMLVTTCILISTIIGGIAGAYFGNGMEAFLAEDIVRLEVHTLFERMIISHLHIMVALLAAAVMLIVFRYTEAKGRWYLIAMICTIPGLIIMSVGAWLVIPDFPNAHMIINVGSIFLLFAAFILTIYGWDKTSKSVLGPDYDSASWFTRIIAVLKDPVKFGLYFQFIWVNLVVTFPGVFVAINLDVYRRATYEIVERSFTTGHWHVLVTLTAIILLLLVVDYFNLKGYMRQVSGWLLILGSLIGFGFSVFYMLRGPNADKTLFFILMDIGVTLIFAGTAIICLILLVKFVETRKNQIN
ncbi:MAG: hypothetical protein ACFFBD_03490 [Candidatus Hodarchaeota archaeon]